MLLGLGGQRRTGRHSIGGDGRPNPLREALRNRGGASYSARGPAPAQTDVEDNFRQQEAQNDKPQVGLDWLNLTAFAPQALQSAIDKLRQDAALKRDGGTTESDTEGPGRAARFALQEAAAAAVGATASLPGRLREAAGVGAAQAATAPASGSRGGARPGGNSLRAALQARGGANRAPAAEPIPEESLAVANGVDLASGSSTERACGEEASPVASALETVREEAEAEHAEDTGGDTCEAAATAAEASPAKPAVGGPQLPAVGVTKADFDAVAASPAASDSAVTDASSAASRRPSDTATATPKSDSQATSEQVDQAKPQASSARETSKESKPLTTPRMTKRAAGSWVTPKEELQVETVKDVTPKAKKEATPSFSEVSKYWNKRSTGFAGPVMGNGNRLSKVEAQATLQRLLSMGHAVDFDEVRRLRKLVKEMESIEPGEAAATTAAA